MKTSKVHGELKTYTKNIIIQHVTSFTLLLFLKAHKGLYYYSISKRRGQSRIF